MAQPQTPGWVALFPGQGSQAVGMGSELARCFPEAARFFDRADEALGEPLSRLIFEGPEGELTLTRNTQPALLTVSCAAWEVLSKRTGSPLAAAGHSLGEYSALVAAGVLSFEDAVRAVRLRGEAMQEAVPVGAGGMAAVIGLDAPAVEELCAALRAPGEELVPANFNAPDQIVVAGHKTAVDRLVAEAPARGVKKAIPLAVSAPFHSPLMVPAARRLEAHLQGISFSSGQFPVVANVDARPVQGGEDARARLVRQVASPVRWVQTMQFLECSLGAAAGVEIGPGRVLAGLARRICQHLRVVSFGKPEELEPARAALGAVES